MAHPRWFKVEKTTRTNLIGSEPQVEIMYVQEKNIGFVYEDGTFEGPPDPAAYVKWRLLDIVDRPQISKDE